MPRPTPWLLSSVVAIALSGCGESRHSIAMLEGLRTGDATAAAGSAEQLYNDGDDALVKQMQLGLIQHLGGDLQQSERNLDQAAALVDDRRKSDALGTAASWLVNDKVTAYAGRAFEHLQVDYYRTLNRILQRQQRDGTWQPPTLLWGMVSKPAVQTPPELPPVELGERAIISARRMTVDQLAETRDLQDGRRYDDDPFARTIAACAVYALPPEERTESDQQLAMAMLTKALEVYRVQRETLGNGKQPFYYEVPAEPAWVRRLWWRHLKTYDPESFGQQLLTQAKSASDIQLLPEGQGMLLVLHHAGLITRLEPLQIGVGAIGFKTPEPSAEERARGHSCTGFSWGSLAFYAKGPGSSIASSWVALPIPGDLVQNLLAPGGATVIGFELPVHRDDGSNPPPATVRIDEQSGETLTVVSDLDAYARASLKDEQPRLLLRTLTRVVAKQAAVAIGTRAVQKSDKDHGDVLGFLVNLAGSALATYSEQADLRCWSTLPDHVEAALIDLPAGEHRLALTTAPAPAAGTIDLGTVRIHPGRLTVVTTRTLPRARPGRSP